MSLYQNIQLSQSGILLKEKENLFDKMLNENKEFGEVKSLFHEIRDIERKLQQQNQTSNNGLNQTESSETGQFH